MEKQNKTGIIYCRVSSKEQVDGTSLSSQEKFCLEYAQREGLNVLKVFIEKGESAKTANRHEFNRAIEFCAQKKGRVDFFIVWKVDRFARNKLDHAAVRVVLKKYSTELRSVTEPIDESPTGKFIEGVLAAAAEFDNDIRTLGTRAGMLARIEAGIWVFRAPIGYYRPLKSKNLLPDPEKAQYVKMAFEKYSTGYYTFRELAEHLFKRGFKNAQEKKPSHQFVEKIISNPIYSGIIRLWNNDFEGSFEPIISKELFKKCVNLRNKKGGNIKPRYTKNASFPLRRFLVCSECGEAITGSYSTGRRGKKYGYYHHHKQTCQKAQFVSKEEMEKKFVALLNELKPTIKHIKIFKIAVLDVWKTKIKKFDELNGRLSREIQLLRVERQRVFDFHRKGSYTEEDFIEQKSLVQQQIEAKETLLDDNRIHEQNVDEVFEHAFNFVKDIPSRWEEGKFKRREQIQNLVFAEKITFDGEKFGTAKLGRIFEVNRSSGDNLSSLVAPRGIEPLLPG